MQKLAATLSRAAKPAFVAGAAAGSTSTAQCRAPLAAKSKEQSPPLSPTKLSVEEGLEGWGFVHLQAPVEKQEVSNALEELALLGGLRRPASPHPALAPAVHVEEVLGDDAGSVAGSSSSTSDGSEANRLLCRADAVEATFGGYYDEEPADPMENLSAVIGNLLNSPAVVNAIQRELVQDPAFYLLMRQVHPGLPSTARPLLITEITSDPGTDTGERHYEGADEDGGPSRPGLPLHELLSRLGRGVVTLAGAVGEAFAHLGNFLRQLGENLRTSLEARPVAGRPTAENERRTRNWESAIVKVACAVAVIVIAKRVRAFA